MIISSNISKNDFEEVIGFFLSWILVGFLTLLFLIFSYLRKTEYNKKHLKKFFDDTDWTFVCVATGYLAPIIVFLIYISNKLSSKKDNIFGWLYDILYKIANVGVNQKENKKKRGLIILVRSEKTCRTVQDAVDFIMDECKNKDMHIDRLVKENKRLTDEYDKDEEIQKMNQQLYNMKKIFGGDFQLQRLKMRELRNGRTNTKKKFMELQNLLKR